MPIQILDAETVSRIAAGEVVERPASIAKELIENALDAGATSISVEVREGGLESLRITDNGCGIPAGETRVAFENHATSKMKSGGDLTDIRTMGFRGEALASIAAVAKVEMRTRARGADSGVTVRVEGGSFLGITEAGCPEGTSITVRDLFYNVPARRAFLKKPSYEAGAVYDVVMRLMLGNPGVSIRLSGNGKSICHSFGDGKLSSAALGVFGREIAQQMVEVDASEGAFRVRGLIGLRECARPNRSQQYFFINGRTVRCPMLNAALDQAARERVGIGMHPICALHITLPNNSVDVNVHPSKLEVRFRDDQYFRTTAESLLFRALAKHDAMLDIPALTQNAPAAQDPVMPAEPPKTVTELSLEEKLARARAQATDSGEMQTDRYFTQLRSPSLNALHESSIPAKSKQTVVLSGLNGSFQTEVCKPDIVPRNPEPVQRAEAVSEKNSSRRTDTQAKGDQQISTEQIRLKSVSDTCDSAANRPEYRTIGVALRTYLLLEANNALILIDQHAAHERILYERYKKQLDLGVASQQLLTPLVCTVTRREMALLTDNQSAIREAGYEIEPFGEREVRVNAVPFVLGEAETKPMLMAMLEELNSLKGAEQDRRRDTIIKLSCRKAVKAGDALNEAEVEALVREMLASDAPPTCPHGRPVARAITKSELEKMFWRT